MDPVQSALHIGQARLRECANQIGVGSDSESYAVHHAVEVNIWPGQDIDICPHAGTDMSQLRFTEIRDGPPYARVNQGEDMLSGRCIGALRNGEVGDASIEGSGDPAVVEVVLRGIDRGLFPGKCPD